MELVDIINDLWDVESYESMPIPEDALKRIEHVLKRSKGLNNLRSWCAVIVRDDEVKRKLMSYCHGNRALVEAPMVLVLLHNIDEDDGVIGGYMPTYPVNAGIAMAHISLTARDMGLGTQWITSFSEEKVAEALDVPDEYRVVGLTPLGTPKSKTAVVGMNAHRRLIMFERFQD